MSKISAISMVIIILSVFAAITLGFVATGISEKFNGDDNKSENYQAYEDSDNSYNGPENDYDNEEQYENTYDDSDISDEYDAEDEEVFQSGDVIDLIDDNIVPCIYGNTDNLYEANSTDEYSSGADPENYYQSTYGKYFTKLLDCLDDDSCRDVSFALDKKYTKLSFKIGIWDCGNDSTGEVIVYKGHLNNKKKILKAKRSPGDREKEFSVDVSDCDTITIRLYNPGWYLSWLVSDGFKLTLK